MTVLILTVVLIGTVTVFLAVALRKMPLNAAPTVILFGLVALICVGGAQVYAHWQDTVDYRICKKGVERSDGNRLYQLSLIDRISQMAPQSDFDDFMLESLEQNLPDRTLSECPKPSW